MADNRDFVQGFENEGGSPVYCEDKKLSEISAKTTISQEGVMLKGTDGAYYEIDKASLSEVIRAELGSILADASKNNGQSVAKVPTLNSTGNVLGASSISDLASVLGVGKSPYISVSLGKNQSQSQTFSMGSKFTVYSVEDTANGKGGLVLIDYDTVKIIEGNDWFGSTITITGNSRNLTVTNNSQNSTSINFYL